jgi:hypothetical protein
MTENSSKVRFSSDIPSKLTVSDDSLSKILLNHVKLPSKNRFKHMLNLKVLLKSTDVSDEKKSKYIYIGMSYRLRSSVSIYHSYLQIYNVMLCRIIVVYIYLTKLYGKLCYGRSYHSNRSH